MLFTINIYKVVQNCISYINYNPSFKSFSNNNGAIFKLNTEVNLVNNNINDEDDKNIQNINNRLLDIFDNKNNPETTNLNNDKIEKNENSIYSYDNIKNLNYLIENEWHHKELEELNTVKFMNKYYKEEGVVNSKNNKFNEFNKSFNEMSLEDMKNLSSDFKNILFIIEKKKKELKKLK